MVDHLKKRPWPVRTWIALALSSAILGFGLYEILGPSGDAGVDSTRNPSDSTAPINPNPVRTMGNGLHNISPPSLRALSEFKSLLAANAHTKEIFLSSDVLDEIKLSGSRLTVDELGQMLTDPQSDGWANTLASLLADKQDPLGAEFIYTYWRMKSNVNVGIQDLLEKTDVTLALFRFPKEKASEIATRFLETEEKGSLRNAFLAAFRYGDPELVVPLLERVFSNDDNPAVRQQALIELGQIGDVRSARALGVALRAAEGQLAQQAIIGLSKQRPEDISMLDLDVLREVYSTSSGRLRAMGQIALAQHSALLTGDERIQLANDVEVGRQSDDPFIRYAATTSLIRMNRGGLDSGQVLMRSLLEVPPEDDRTRSVIIGEIIRSAQSDVEMRKAVSDMVLSGQVNGIQSVMAFNVVALSLDKEGGMEFTASVIVKRWDENDLLRRAVEHMILSDRGRAGESLRRIIQSGAVSEEGIGSIRNIAGGFGISVD